MIPLAITASEKVTYHSKISTNDGGFYAQNGRDAMQIEGKFKVHAVHSSIAKQISQPQ
jgi:hypothetical protein